MVFGHASITCVASNGRRLLGVVITLASMVTAMVTIVYSCSSGENRLPVSLGGAVPSRLLAATETQNEGERYYDVVQVQGFAEDYRTFNGYYNRAGCRVGVIPCWLSEKTVLYYDRSGWKIAVIENQRKNAVAPDMKNGRLPLQEAWRLPEGRKMKITIKGFDQAKMQGFADADGEQTSISDHENAEATRLAIKHLSEETGLDFKMDNSISSDGLKQSSDVEANAEVDQHKPLVMTGVDANHSADSPGQENFEGEVGSDVDQNDDLIMTGVGANHDGELGFDVDQNGDPIKTGVDANNSADSPGQDDLNGEINPEIHRGEKLQQNSGGEQNHSSHSGAMEADMTDDNSSGTNHSLPAPVQDDLKREPAADAHGGNKRQPKSDGQNHSHDSTAQSNRSDGYADNFSTTELDFWGANHTNMTVEETPEIFSFHSILAILAAVLSLMCASVCMVVSCFWRGSENMMTEKGRHWGVEDSESEAILPQS